MPSHLQLPSTTAAWSLNEKYVCELCLLLLLFLYTILLVLFLIIFININNYIIIQYNNNNNNVVRGYSNQELYAFATCTKISLKTRFCRTFASKLSLVAMATLFSTPCLVKTSHFHSLL